METKYYPLFSVDTCESEWAMGYVLIGAESPEDLIKHWKQTGEHRPKGLKDRITAIPDAFTTTPYKVIDRYGYYE